MDNCELDYTITQEIVSRHQDDLNNTYCCLRPRAMLSKITVSCSDNAVLAVLERRNEIHRGDDRYASTRAALEYFFAQAATACPTAKLKQQDFFTLLAEKIPFDQDIRAALDQLDGKELYLCLAAVHGLPGAEHLLEQTYFTQIAPLLNRMSFGTGLSDEVAQRVRQRLLMPESSQRPRVLDYAGQGNLRGLVRVCAIRLALDVRRRRDREVPLDSGVGTPADLADDPELVYIKEEHRREFKDLFGAAVQTLSSRERNILRLHYSEHESIDFIGAFYNVHRATAARWLRSARESLGRALSNLVKKRWNISGDKLGEVVALIQSQLDLSLSHVFDSR